MTSYNQWIFLAILVLTQSIHSEGDTILALYDALEPGGYEQKLGYELAVEKFSNQSGSNSADVVFHSSQCGMVESQIVQDLIASRHDLMTPDADGRLVIVGGCCQTSYCQHWFPQITCSSQEGYVSQSNLISSQPGFVVIFPALISILSELKVSSVCLYNSHQHTQDVSALLSLMTSQGVSVSLQNLDHSCTPSSSQVQILLDEQSLCDSLASRHEKTTVFILLTVIEKSITSMCQKSADTKLFILRPQHKTNFELLSELSSRMEPALLSIADTQQAVYEAACSYDSMMSALYALNQTTSSDGIVNYIHNNPSLTSELISQDGDDIPVLIISVTPLADADGVSTTEERVIGVWSPANIMSKLNLTESMRADVEAISEGGNSTMTTSAYDLSDYDRHLVALGVMSSFAFMGIIYSAALVAFNCRKGKDRIIKLTSPNINLVTCAGCVLSLLCIPLLGIERPITSDLKFISSLQQAGIFVLNIGQTIIYSSILVKTWRVHRIFKKMHLSSKGTKDEHLLLMIIGFSLVEIVINVLWLKLDHISCHFSANQDGLLVCWSEYQLLWSILLSGYKIIVILITLFYAWHVRHVKLPSLQDSSFILTNSLVIIAVTVISLPVVASARTANLTRLVTISLAILIWVFSTLSLLLAPKIFLVRNKDNSNSAVRFLFGESLKKKNMDKEDNHKPTGCCAKLRLCNSQSESSMGDSVLSQEIETLKQLIKEKDDSIRELTDRLFFGADRFKAYVHEKTTPRPKPQVVTDNYYASARKTKYSTAARSNQCSLGGRRNHTSPSLASPASSVDSGTVDDIYSTPQSRRLSKSADLSVRTMDTTLSPIREMSVGRELVELDKQGRQLNHQVSRVDSDRSATPTTDSAINMSQSSSEDEQRINRPSRHASSRPGSRRSQQSESDHISIAGSTKFRQLSLHSNQGGLEVAINNDLEGSASMTETDLCGTQRSAPTIPAKITTITDGKIDSALNSGLKQSRRADNGSSEMINKKPIASPRQHLPPRRLSNSTPSDNEEPYRLLTSQEHAMYEAVNKARHIILNEGSEPITEQDTKSQPITKDVNTHQPITRLSGRSNINRSNKSYIPTQVRPQTLSKSEMKSEAISDDKDTANNYLSDSVVGDEVELEIVFPKGKSLRYYSEL